MKDLNQLLLKFDLKQNYQHEDFYVSKSNFYAFNLINKWPKWEKNILNIYGEKHCGKTHLSNIFKKIILLLINYFNCIYLIASRTEKYYL